MALTKEVLTANAALSGLTEEQITAITTLSTNDENTVIGTHTGKIYREMDEKISSITGIPRNGDEKTYLYLERATAGFKEKAEKVSEFETKVQELEATKTRLERTIADGAQDVETKRKLDQANADLEAVKSQFNTLKEQHDNAVKTHSTELFSVKVQNEVSNALSGFKFKSDIPEGMTKLAVENAAQKIQSMSSDFVDDGNGGKRLVFKDQSGAIMNNPNNGLNPYTAKELIQKEFDTLGILDTGKGAGAGSGPNGGGGSGTGGVTVSGAKTRVEAHKIIHDGLAAKGLTVGSDQYNSELTQAYKDNNVLDLPVQ